MGKLEYNIYRNLVKNKCPHTADKWAEEIFRRKSK